MSYIKLLIYRHVNASQSVFRSPLVVCEGTAGGPQEAISSK